MTAESLFDQRDHHPTSVIALRLAPDAWREPARFAELLTAFALLHNRVLVLRRYKEHIRKGQLLHPALYLADDEKLAVKSFPADGQPCELYAYPAVARTVAELVAEVARAAPAEVPFRTLISLFKDELEILTRRHYREEEARRLFKLNVLGESLAGATVSLAESLGEGGP